jgi:hypothetical protein
VTDHLNPLRDAVVAALKTLERDTS